MFLRLPSRPFTPPPHMTTVCGLFTKRFFITARSTGRPTTQRALQPDARDSSSAGTGQRDAADRNLQMPCLQGVEPPPPPLARHEAYFVNGDKESTFITRELRMMAVECLLCDGARSLVAWPSPWGPCCRVQGPHFRRSGCIHHNQKRSGPHPHTHTHKCVKNVGADTFSQKTTTYVHQQRETPPLTCVDCAPAGTAQRPSMYLRRANIVTQ